jgi:hypothetical protein
MSLPPQTPKRVYDEAAYPPTTAYRASVRARLSPADSAPRRRLAPLLPSAAVAAPADDRLDTDSATENRFERLADDLVLRIVSHFTRWVGVSTLQVGGSESNHEFETRLVECM